MSAFVEHVCQYLHTVEYQEDDVILIKDNLSSSIVNIMADSHCPLHKEVALYYHLINDLCQYAGPGWRGVVN